MFLNMHIDASPLPSLFGVLSQRDVNIVLIQCDYFPWTISRSEIVMRRVDVSSVNLGI